VLGGSVAKCSASPQIFAWLAMAGVAGRWRCRDSRRVPTVGRYSCVAACRAMFTARCATCGDRVTTDRRLRLCASRYPTGS